MSETYSKLFSSITASTIWAEPNPTRIVWITMLAMSDRHGYVGASIPGLANTARVSIAECEIAINSFLSPDIYSRSQDHDGRRIEVSDRGWVLINYERFRDMRDEEARKEFERNRKRESRAKLKELKCPDMSAMSLNVPECPTVSAQAYADTDTELDLDHSISIPDFDRFWKQYPKKVAKAAAEKAWRKLKATNDLEATILRAIDAHKATEKWQENGGAFIPHPASWLNQRRWEDELPASQSAVYDQFRGNL